MPHNHIMTLKKSPLSLMKHWQRCSQDPPFDIKSIFPLYQCSKPVSCPVACIGYCHTPKGCWMGGVKSVTQQSNQTKTESHHSSKCLKSQCLHFPAYWDQRSENFQNEWSFPVYCHFIGPIACHCLPDSPGTGHQVQPSETIPSFSSHFPV